MDKLKKIVACGVLFLTLVLSIGAVAPKEIRLEKASYRKITISWQAPDATTQVAHYKVFRDGTAITNRVTTNKERMVSVMITGPNCHNAFAPLTSIPLMHPPSF